jgi:serine phosphatase RsbU (regulator of sigma subunit)
VRINVVVVKAVLGPAALPPPPRPRPGHFPATGSGPAYGCRPGGARYRYRLAVRDGAEHMLNHLLEAARLTVPDDLAALLVDQGRALGADEVTLYLVDHDQYLLVPLPGQAGADRSPLAIDSTLAGLCFRRLEVLKSEGGRRMWVPVLDGLERLGVLELGFAGSEAAADDEQVLAFAALIAETVVVKDAYGDLFHKVRRRQPMSMAAEIAWNLLPPLTFGTDRLVISAVLAPAYNLGGDSFDYAVDATTARFAVFDAMGHGLDAGWLATLAIGAYRSSRRHNLDLAATIDAIDAALNTQFSGERFVTAVLAELDLASGQLRWHSAGHPAPLVLRSGRVVKTLTAGHGLPLGLGHLNTRTGIAEERLERGDRLLLYTDGVPEARSPGGEFFGLDRLADLIAREDAAGQPTPEIMRRLMHAVLAHQRGDLRDDATTMLVEWQGGGADRITDTGPEAAPGHRPEPGAGGQPPRLA